MPVVQVVEMLCEGPRCGKGQDGTGTAKLLRWSPEHAKQNIAAVPDDCWRFITVVLFDDQKFSFCSVRCLKHFLESKDIYLLSPREKAEREALNQEVDDRRLEKKRGVLV